MRGLGRIAAACLCALGLAPAAAHATTFKPCKDDRSVRCATLQVPLDRTGAQPGTIGLHVERVPAATLTKPKPAAATGAIVALAGGPGQPATQFTSDFAFAFGADHATRDVVTFDQRGTGRSGLLRCPALEKVTLLSHYPAAGADCAQRLGDRRGLYTTSDSVDDLEAVRQAIGVDRIAIYGASYGTKVALAYAARYPDHVERLILDSVLPLEGPDPFYADTLGAMPRVMRESCGDGCDFTADPGADLAALGRRLAEGPARGYVVDRRGRHQPAAIGSLRLFFLLLAGDFAPDLREALPAAIHSAASGDPAQLLRLATLSEAGSAPVSARDFSSAVYAATVCEEAPLPWPRGAPFAERPGDAADAAARRGDDAFSPFGAPAVLSSDLIALCSEWPEATAAPAAYGPLPDVPALILDGRLDLRTPLEGAERVAAQLPHSTLIPVAATGHSVLGSDESPCSLSAVERFLAGHTPRATCARGPLPLIPDEPVPVSLADVKPALRAPRSVARLLNAVDLTIDDVESQAGTQAVLLFSGDSDAPIAGGGLRAGRFREKPDAVSLRGIVFVPGVHVSGRLLNRGARIGSFRVTADGKRGRVEYRGGGYVTGHFGGHSFRVKLRIDDGKPPVIQLGKHLRPEAPPPPRVGR